MRYKPVEIAVCALKYQRYGHVTL